MEKQLVFGDGRITVSVPDDAREVSPGISLPLPAAEDLSSEVRQALAHPLDGLPLRELARRATRVTVAFDDPTVPCYAPLWSTAPHADLDGPPVPWRHDRSDRQAGLHGRHGHPVSGPVGRPAPPPYREVWDRVLPVTRDPYEARGLFEPELAARQDYIEKYRTGFGFHPTHAIMALYPLKRLRHAGRIVVAGTENPATVRHVGFDPAATVEDARGWPRRSTGPARAWLWSRIRRR